MYTRIILSKLILFFLAACCISCQVKHSDGGVGITVDALPYADTLSVQRSVKTDTEDALLTPLKTLNLNDQYLIISERRNENFFNVLKLPEIDYLYSWGTISQGPEADEFTTTPFFINTAGDQLIVYDAMAMRLKFIAVHDSGVEKMDEKELSYTGQMDPLNRVRRIKDDLYFVDYGTTMEETDREHVALEPGNPDTLFTFGRYPESELEGFDRYGIYLKNNISNPEGSRFLTAYYYQNFMKLYNSDGEVLKTITINDPYIEKVDVEEPRDYLYRTTAWASDDYIYMLGYHSLEDDIYETPNSSVKTSIEVWNWDGEPVYRAYFDRLITQITVSELHSKIYGMSTLAENEIFEYNLSL